MVYCLKLIDFIHREAGYYLKGLGHSEEAGFLGMKIVSSWLTKTMPGEYARLHDHGTTDIAGVYYFSTDGDDGDLFFTSPIANAKASKSWAQEKINYPPQQGSLLLFPGWLEHGVGTNLKDHARISLSFNVEVVELNELPSSNYRRFTNAQK